MRRIVTASGRVHGFLCCTCRIEGTGRPKGYVNLDYDNRTLCRPTRVTDRHIIIRRRAERRRGIGTGGRTGDKSAPTLIPLILQRGSVCDHSERSASARNDALTGWRYHDCGRCTSRSRCYRHGPACDRGTTLTSYHHVEL